MAQVPGAAAQSLARAAEVSGPKLAIAYVHPGMVHETFSRSIHRFIAQHPKVPVVSARSGSMLARARNDVLRAVTHLECDILVWLDTDIVFEPEQIDELAAWVDPDHPVVTGAYKGIDYGTGAIFWQHVPHEVNPNLGYGYHEINGTGMGFCAIDINIIEPLLFKFPFPYAELYTEEFGMTDQDVGFCIRAMELDYGTFLVNIPVGHIKEQVI